MHHEALKRSFFHSLSMKVVNVILFSCFFFSLYADEATFAGGCFWCVQHDFDEVHGVMSTTVGYTGGAKKDPTYEEVSSGTTGHVEAVRVEYNPKEISYSELLNFYWHDIDPTRNDGQFCDEGAQYRPIIFYNNEQQKQLAIESKDKFIAGKKIQPILVEIRPMETFYPAEEYHQEYYQKNPLRYKFYRFNCGRDKRLKEVWAN